GLVRTQNKLCLSIRWHTCLSSEVSSRFNRLVNRTYPSSRRCAERFGQVDRFRDRCEVEKIIFGAGKTHQRPQLFREVGHKWMEQSNNGRKNKIHLRQGRLFPR